MRKGDKAGKKPPATAMGHYFKPELLQNMKNSCGLKVKRLKGDFKYRYSVKISTDCVARI